MKFLAVVLLFVAIANCQETQQENEVEERKDKRNIKLSYGAGLLGNGAGYDNFNNFASPINRNLGRGYIPINEHGGYDNFGGQNFGVPQYNGNVYGSSYQNQLGVNSLGSSFGGYSGGNYPISYSNRAFYPSSSLNRFAYSSPVTTYPYGGVGTVGASGFGGYDNVNGLNNNYNGLNGLNGFAGGYQQQGFY